MGTVLLQEAWNSLGSGRASIKVAREKIHFQAGESGWNEDKNYESQSRKEQITVNNRKSMRILAAGKKK